MVGHTLCDHLFHYHLYHPVCHPLVCPLYPLVALRPHLKGLLNGLVALQYYGINLLPHISTLVATPLPPFEILVVMHPSPL